jgi:hypothetical protein
MCALYGPRNGALLAKMVENIFAQAPALREDLIHSWQAFFELCNQTCQQYGLEVCLPNGLPSGTAQGAQGGPESVPQQPGEALDLLLYIGDLAATLTAFVEVFPNCQREAHSCGLVAACATLFDGVLDMLDAQCAPQAALALHTRETGAGPETSRLQPTADLLAGVFEQVRQDALQLLHTLVSRLYSEPLQAAAQELRAPSSSTPGTPLDCDELENRLYHTMDVLLAREWLCDALCEEQTLASVFFQLAECVHDKARLEHYKSALIGDASMPLARREPANAARIPSEATAMAASALDPQVALVKDMMPELGLGFIRKALEACGVSWLKAMCFPCRLRWLRR